MLKSNRQDAISVSIAGEHDLDAWQAFADASPAAGAMHHAAWFLVLRDAYNVRPHFLIARDVDGIVQGILPGYVTRSIFTGAHYTTLEGGPLAAGAVAHDALLGAVRALRTERGVRFVQVRGGRPEDRAPVAINTIHTIVRTDDGAENTWSRIKPKSRWGIRQAEKQDLTVTFDAGLDELDVFYSLYAEHMRELGTPVFGDKTLCAMKQHLGPARLRLYILRYHGVAVGGMLCIVHGRHWTDLYAIVRRAKATEFSNYLLYWHVIHDAAQNGVLDFDMGRSARNSNVHLFKRKWGGTDVDVPYLFYPAGEKAGSLGLLREDRKEGLAQRLWSRMPLWFCNSVGPAIRSGLPFI